MPATTRLTLGLSVFFTISFLLCTSCTPPNFGRPVTSTSTPKIQERYTAIDSANTLFESGDFTSAEAAYRVLGREHVTTPDQTLESIAICEFGRSDFRNTVRLLNQIDAPTAEDTWLIAHAEVLQSHYQAAMIAARRLPKSSLDQDIELLEYLARLSAERGLREESWRFFTTIQRNDPSSPALERLRKSGNFNFYTVFFGYGPDSFLNYARGARDGTKAWGSDTIGGISNAASGLWRLCNHPLVSIEQIYSAAKSLFTADRIALLFEPTYELAKKLSPQVVSLYWRAWEASKDSVIREYKLDPDSFGDQKQIHEIAAGRMAGYVAPDIVIAIVTAGQSETPEILRGAKILEEAGLVVKTEEGVEKVSMLARSAEYIKCISEYSKLRKISWLDEADILTLKQSSHFAPRFSEFCDDLYKVRDFKSANRIIRSLVSGKDIDSHVNGFLFQLKRAGYYADRGELKEIGRKFTVRKILPGQPLSLAEGEADLVLLDGTLIETKRVSEVLTLSGDFPAQIAKMNRAVIEGQFKRFRVECNMPISKGVIDRCSVLAAPNEIVGSLSP